MTPSESLNNLIAYLRNPLLMCLVGLIMVGALSLLFSRGSEAKQTVRTQVNDDVARNRVHKDFGALPLSFELNQGQIDKRVRFAARGNGLRLFLTPDEAVFALSFKTSSSADSTKDECEILRMALTGGRTNPRVVGVDRLPGISNYFIGNDPRRWRTSVPSFSKVKYEGVYPGIDLIYYGNQNQLEYDFVVAPKASPRKVQLSFQGAQNVTIDDTGNLILKMANGEIHQSRPIAYQMIGAHRQEVEVRYRLKGHRVGFELGRYDKTQPLTIDPILLYSTFLGGSSSEQGLGIAVDAQGSAYVTGTTLSTDFPVAGAAQGTKGAFTDAFVTKLNPAGNALIYSTYIGGNGDDNGNAIAVDSQGNAYVVGLTGSGSFPTTFGSFQTSKDGLLDSFVTKLSPSGSALAYSTFLGGDNNENLFAITVDAAGNAFVAGRTDSTMFRNFPFPSPRNGSAVHKSLNGGGQWSPSSSGFTGNLANDFAQDPTNPAIVYAGSNNGVFKSINSGANWTLTGQARTSTAPTFTNVVVVDPSNPNIIYAATSNGIYKSVDGGGLYDQKNAGLSIPFSSALLIDPTTPTTLYAGTHSGIFKSTNGADSWTEIENGITGLSPSVTEMVFDPSNSATIYVGSDRGLFKTTNAGALWTQINTGVLLGLSPQIRGLVVDPTAPSTLYASSSQNAAGVLFKTTDGGASWSASDTGLSVTVGGQSFPAIAVDLAVDPVTPATVYAATTNGSFFKSTDSGANWSVSNNGLSNMNTTAITIDSSNHNNLYLGVSIGNDAFVMGLNPFGSVPVAFLNVGGSDNDEARDIALDGSNNIYITGNTSSPNFPTANAFDSSYGGFTDAFVLKTDPAASSILFSTYLGGSIRDEGRGIAVLTNNVHVTGITNSSDFPLMNPIKPALAQFDTDAFVTKFNTAGSLLDFSTYLGGESIDQGFAIAVDGSGVYVTGSTSSPSFPTLDAPQPQPGSPFVSDAFVTKLAPAGTSFIYSTYLGGFASDQGNGIALDSLGNAYIIGTTFSFNFPLMNPFQSQQKSADAFVTKIGVDAELSIAKTDSRDPVLVNSQFSYSLQVNNAGPSSATNVVVTDNLPAELSFVSATPSQGNCSFNSPIVTCQLGSLAPSTGAVVTITATGTTAVTVTNSAAVTATEPDSNSANNSSSQSTKISTSPSISGRVKDNANMGVSGVLMTLSGGQAATTTTDSTGFYQFAELPASATYTVTPSKTNLSFNPQSFTFNNLSADQTGDFVASTCTFSLSPLLHSLASSGGTGSVDVTSLPGCPWTATTNDSFINITAGGSGVGNGTVIFDVTATTSPRAGRLTIAGLNFPVYQGVNSCSLPDFFQAKYLAQHSPTNLSVADLNGDNFPDFVVANGGGLSGGIGLAATVLLNNGTGLFTSTAVDTGMGQLAGGFVLADFNGDQRPDIAVFNVGNPAIVRILFNNGNGGFGQSSVNIPYTPQGQFSLTRRLFTSDVNIDGKPDILVQPATNNIAVLLGNGSGGFNEIAPVNFNVVDSPIGLADVNGDGKPDLLFGSGNSDRMLSVRLGDGSGGFGSSITSTTPVVNSAFETADFNGDGKIDIALSVAIPMTGSNGVAVLLGDGMGHFALKSTFSPGSPSIGDVAVADFNRDAKPDVVLTRADTKVFIIPGDGLGGLGPPLEISVSGNDNFPGNFGVGAGDFDGDTKPDVAVANSTGGAFTLRNNCSGSPVIFGRVSDSNTNGIAGVTVTLTGGQNQSTQTDSNGNYLFLNLTAGANYVITPAKDNFRFAPVSTNVNDLNGVRSADFVGTPIVIQFAHIHFLVNEGDGTIQVNVTRTGDLSGVSTVDYSTVNGSASDRSDYTAALGTLRFEAGQSQKSFQVLITDDALVEGFESLTLVLSNPTGAILASPQGFLPSTVVMEIQDNDSNPSASNPIDSSVFFVRQHYHDFLNREPDLPGLQFWVDGIEGCGADAHCREVKRINTSAAFFLSIEFQNTGYLVYRTYKAAYGDTTSPNVLIPVPIVRLIDFIPDTQRMGQGVVVGQGNWEQILEDNKRAYILDFVQRLRFTTAYPSSMSADQFVTQLDQNAGGVLSAAEKANLVAMLGATPSDVNKRALVLRAVAEDSDLHQRETNRAFVLMQYYGYLRRNPDDPQDTDFRGWEFWLNKLNQFNGNFIHAEMVRAFLSSIEYRRRFGQ